MNNDAYFLAVNGQSTGPYSLAQVQEMRRSGMVSAQALFWCKGEPDWQPVSNLPLIPGAPVPPAAYAPPGPGAVVPAYPATIVPGYPPSTSGLAITSFILGLASFLCFFPCLPAVICGHLALSQIKKSAGWLGGRGFALAGLVMGYFYIGIAGLFLLAAIFIPAVAAIFDHQSTPIQLAPTVAAPTPPDLDKPRQLGLAIIRYADDHDGTTPPALDALFPKYLEDRSVLSDGEGDDPADPGYDYLIANSKIDHPAPDTVLLRGRHETADHQRVLVYADGRVELKADP